MLTKFLCYSKIPRVWAFFKSIICTKSYKNCEIVGAIPIVDMYNFPTIYNEKEKILNTYNSWEYFFEQLSNYSLEEVYQSKNVIITEYQFYSEKEDFFFNITDSEDLIKILREEINLKKLKKTSYYLRDKLFEKKS